MRSKLVIFIFMLIALRLGASETPPPPGNGFAENDLGAWKEREFAGHSEYRLHRFANGQRALHATTDSKASVLYREVKIDLTKTPWIEWYWNVERHYPGINEKSKAGDDFPARVYVVAKTGPFPWQTLAVNYVWASNLTEGDSWRSPYTEKSAMIAVRSGGAQLGQWLMEQRNVAEDFYNQFGRKIDEIVGYAVMVDGDNAAQSGSAWFGEIRFSTDNDRSKLQTTSTY